MTDLKEKFRNWLIKQELSEKTPSGKQSTVYDYIKTIDRICKNEDYITWDELASNIFSIIDNYQGKSLSALNKYNEFLFVVDSFLSCFWTIEQNQSETTELDNYKGNLPKKIRYFYNDNENLDFIPEDYDSTFEFVPRMCTKEECNACPFNMDENKVLDLCHSQKGRLCPVIKLCSGSNFNCTNPDKCPIRKYHTKL